MANLKELKEKLGYSESEIPFWTIYNDVLEQGEIVSPRGLKVLEVQNYHYDLPPYVRFANFEARKLSISYIKDEFLWYLKGDPTDTSIAERAKIWRDMINPDGVIHSNYGQYVFGKMNQFRYVVDTLLKDPDSRRASMAIMNQTHVLSGDKDLPCTYALNFRIRNNRLKMTVHMRSQDAIYGMGNDAPAFSFIHEMVYESLKPVYTKLELGTYDHYADSFHVYEKHFTMLFNIVKDSKFEEIVVPRISGKEEVDFLILNAFNDMPTPDSYLFTKWLLEK